MKRFDTAIIGGGASGLFCAAALGSGNGVLLLERGDRLGRKLSATGNGQGNVTNEHVGETGYFSSERSALSRVDEYIGRHGGREMIGFLENLGGLFFADGRGRVYPAGRQASAVTDMLRRAVADRGVETKTGEKAVSLTRSQGGFVILSETPQGRGEYLAENVVLCAGGKAAGHFGTDGHAYALARGFGHTLTPLFPSLVQLKTDTEHIKTLKGIRVGGAFVSAYVGKKFAGEVFGDLLFTDYGVSGDAVFRLSALVADKIPGGQVSLSVDLLGEATRERLTEVLARKRKKFPELPESELLCGILNNQVGRAVMRRCKGKSLDEIVDTVKGFSLSVTGTLGFDCAQVTKGGIPLSETDENLQSRFAKGLYFAGEILDVDGECGGYNLQWAYTSARVVADALNAKREKRKGQV